jgi:hypothetical protein
MGRGRPRGTSEVGEGPCPIGRRWVAGTGPAAAHAVGTKIGEAAPLTCGPEHSVGHLNPFKSVNSIQMNLNQTYSNFI